MNHLRKTPKATLKRKADKMFSEIIRSVGHCQMVGLDSIRCSGVLQCAHIVGRANHALRWDTLNALSLCQAHHMYYTHEPWAWQELIALKFPERYEYVNEWRNEIWDKDIEKVIEGLRNIKPFDDVPDA